MVEPTTYHEDIVSVYDKCHEILTEMQERNELIITLLEEIRDKIPTDS